MLLFIIKQRLYLVDLYNLSNNPNATIYTILIGVT